MPEPTAPDIQKPITREPVTAMRLPITETPQSVSFLGVTLPKATEVDSKFVTNKAVYADFIDDAFSLELQRDMATSFKLGEPVLVEGGTSIGKTTAIRRMASLLGWEVHYVNLNGATDVENLMGRYVPNPNKKTAKDPEYVFADGQITQGLRQEPGKIKMIIIDEYNSARPEILIRLHEVLDALKRGESVTLSEDASETISVDKEHTKIVGLMNPPGKGYFGREPLDPAQIRRWTYLKEPTNLPEDSFTHSTDALFSLTPMTAEVPDESYRTSRDQALSMEELKEIPGIKEILEKFREFHKAAKEFVAVRTVAAEQPQLFSFDDRMDPARVRDYVLNFYNGDITETFQDALRYFYSNKLELSEDRAKFEEILKKVEYKGPEGGTKSKGLDRIRNRTFTSATGEVTRYRPEAITLTGGQTLEPGQAITQDGVEEIFLGVDIVDGTLLTISSEEFNEGTLEDEGKNVSESLLEDIFKGEVLGKEAIKVMEQKCKDAGIEVSFESENVQVQYSEEELRDFAPELHPGNNRSAILRPEFMTVNGEQMPITIKNLKKLFNGKNPFGTGELFSNQGWYDSEIFVNEVMVPRYAFPTIGLLQGSLSKSWDKQEKLLNAGESRRNAVEAVWDSLLQYANADNNKPLINNYDWTSTLMSTNDRVGVGSFGEDGLDLEHWVPNGSAVSVGVVTQR